MNTEGIDFFSDPKWPMQLPEETVKLEQLPQEPGAKPVPIESNLENSLEDIHRTRFPQSRSERKEPGSPICLVKQQEKEKEVYIFNPTSQVEQRQQISSNVKLEDQQPASNQLKEEMSFSYDEDSSENFSEKKRNAKYKILSKASKLFLVNQTQYMSVTQVARMYGVSINNLCRWKKTCERKAGAGRKVTDIQLQQKLIDWINKQKLRNGGISLSRKSIQEKAKFWSSNPDFKASKGWFERFITRNKQLELMEILGISLKVGKTKREEMIEFPSELFICSTKGVRSSERLRVKKEALKKQEEIYEYIDE